MRTSLLLLPLSFVLSGCFLTQSKPSAQFPASQGILAIQDIHGTIPDGEKKMGSVIGQFFAESGRSYLSRIDSRLARLAKDRSTYASMECTKKTENAGRAPTSADRAFRPIDAGKISFGSTLHTTLVPLDVDENYVYSKEIDPDMSTGLYEFAGEGSSVVPKFNYNVSMPEPLYDVTVSGFTLTESNYQIRREQGLTIEWRAPITMTDANLMMVELRSISGDTKTTVSCEVGEKVFLNGATHYQWMIPTSILNHLPSSTATRIDFIRGHAGIVTTSNPKVLLEGLRDKFGLGEIL